MITQHTVAMTFQYLIYLRSAEHHIQLVGLRTEVKPLELHDYSTALLNMPVSPCMPVPVIPSSLPIAGGVAGKAL